VASKKKKKSTIQTAAALATMGMPAPVQQVASSKLGSLVMIVGGLILVATGAITISWQGGLPSVKVNEARAEQLKQEVQQRARIAADRVVSEWGPATAR
jgi:hypothetical protein